MKPVILLSSLILSSAVSMALAQTTPTTAPAVTSTVGSDVKRDMTEVPVRRVVLFSSGVGFFQHSGKVSGNAATELSFKTEQINDILKTLVVSDTTANGSVKSITYGSQNPIDRTLKSFQIDISSNPTLANILNQIRGTKISLTLPDEKVEGTVLGVEEKDRPVGPAGKPEDAKVVKVSYVNVIAKDGIRSVPLEDVRKLDIEDPALQDELNSALAALAQARDKDKKPVIVNFDGTGDRQVTLAYLIETPIWKSSYRLILPDASSKDDATLLGWAIVENQTDNDWNNITLDLVGGRPISFIEDLYRPLYVPRPRVQTKTYASLTPQTYDEGIDTSGAQKVAATPVQPGAPAGAAGRGGRGGAGGGGGFGGGGGGGGGFGGGRGGAAESFADAAASPMETPAPVDYAQGVKSIADASKVGEMFQYSVKGVTLPRQRSSMIPIITQSVPFDRVSIYNRSVLARNPLMGVRLKNKTQDYLLAGPVAVLDKVKKADGTIADSYAGDASIDDVPAGQERLLSYAIDQEVTVDSKPRDDKSRLITGSILKGVLNLKYTDSATQEYAIDNKADMARTILVEDPITYGYELKDPPKALEKTDKVYRFEVPVPAGKTVLFDVVEQKTRMQTMAIMPMDPGTIESYASTAEIPAKVKAVLQTAGDKRMAMVDAQRKLSQKNNEKSQILQDEQNTRANINVLSKGTKGYDDAVADLAAKEADLKKVNQEIKDLQAASDKARSDLEAYLSDMNVEG